MPNEEDPAYSVSTASIRALKAGSFALGAVAVGGFALGAAAVGALAIGRLFIGKAHIKMLEIDELTVRRLTLEPDAETNAAPIDYKAAVKELLTQFSQASDRIERTQAETARLRAETRIILTEIQTLMSIPKATVNRTEETPEQVNAV